MSLVFQASLKACLEAKCWKACQSPFCCVARLTSGRNTWKSWCVSFLALKGRQVTRVNHPFGVPKLEVPCFLGSRNSLGKRPTLDTLVTLSSSQNECCMFSNHPNDLRTGWFTWTVETEACHDHTHTQTTWKITLKGRGIEFAFFIGSWGT